MYKKDIQMEALNNDNDYDTLFICCIYLFLIKKILINSITRGLIVCVCIRIVDPMTSNRECSRTVEPQYFYYCLFSFLLYIIPHGRVRKNLYGLLFSSRKRCLSLLVSLHVCYECVYVPYSQQFIQYTSGFYLYINISQFDFIYILL